MSEEQDHAAENEMKLPQGPVNADEVSRQAREDFHTHLEGCRRCANHPFDLCTEGARLLELAAAEAVDQPAPEPEQ